MHTGRMQFVARTSSWDPLGSPLPANDARKHLVDAEQERDRLQAIAKGMHSVRYLGIGAALFVFGGFLRTVLLGVLQLDPTSPVGLGVSAAPWVLAVVFLAVGFAQSKRQTDAIGAAILVAKLRFAGSHGWKVAWKQKRYRELQAQFPAFFTPRGGSPAVEEEWWGACMHEEREYDLWLAQLSCRMSRGKSSFQEYSHIVGIRMRSLAPTSVSLIPEDMGHKLLHLFRGEYKTGNAAFDGAFHIGTSADGQSSALPGVLNPPFIAACLALCSSGNRPRKVYLHRERDILLVRWLQPDFENGMPLLQPQSPNDATASMQQLETQATELLAPVLQLVHHAGL